MKSFIAVVFLFCFVASNAQETEKLKRFRVNEFNLLLGNSSNMHHYGTLEEFRKLAPQSELLKNDFTGFNSSQGYSYSYSSNTIFAAMVGIQLRDKNKKTYKLNPQIRAGFNFSGNTSFSDYLYLSNTTRVDTLASNTSGKRAFTDSVNSQYYYMNYFSQNLSLDLSILFRTNPEERWSLFTGVGIVGGASINSFTEIQYAKHNYEHSYFENDMNNIFYGSTTYYDDGERISERFKNKSNFIVGAYLPLGIDFRIGKKRDFWKRMHIFYEIRPGISMNSVPEIGNYINATILHGFGLKINWE